MKELAQMSEDELQELTYKLEYDISKLYEEIAHTRKRLDEVSKHLTAKRYARPIQEGRGDGERD